MFEIFDIDKKDIYRNKNKIYSALIFITIIALLVVHYFDLYGVFTQTKEVVIDYTQELNFIYGIDFLNRKVSQFYVLLEYTFNFSLFVLAVLLWTKRYSFWRSISIQVRIPLIPIGMIAILGLFFLFMFLPQLTFGLFRHEFVNISFWTQEIENGVLSLRISAFLIFLNVMGKIGVFVRINGWGEKRGLTGNPSWSTKGEKILYRLLPDLLQLYFYMIVIYVLFVSVLSGKNELKYFVAIASWALLFILDDWKIITEYKNILNIQMLKSHKTRISVLNGLLFVSASIMTCQLIPFYVSSLIIGLMIVTLLLGEYVSDSKYYNSAISSSAMGRMIRTACTK